MGENKELQVEVEEIRDVKKADIQKIQKKNDKLLKSIQRKPIANQRSKKVCVAPSNYK